MAEIRNYTMNFSFGMTPATHALACTEVHRKREQNNASLES
jgi:hypothetical protein